MGCVRDQEALHSWEIDSGALSAFSGSGELLFDDRAMEVLRKANWQVADFLGVEVLSYCVMSNHFHVPVRAPDGEGLARDDKKLLRRYGVLYPNPTEHQQMPRKVFEHLLRDRGRVKKNGRYWS